MGLPAALLVSAHLFGCAVIALLGWMYWVLTVTEGGSAPSGPYVFALSLVLLVVALGLWLALLWGRRALALLLVGAEVAAALALWRVGGSWNLDSWLLVLVLTVGITGIGAVLTSEQSRR